MNVFNWKPEIGMTVYVVPVDKRYEPFSDKINKVGRKYFTTYRNIRFDIKTKDDSTEIYFAQHICFNSKESYDKYISYTEMRHFIEFNIRKLPLKYVKSVYNILKNVE